MSNNIKNRINDLENKLSTPKVNVVFIENNKYTYYLSNTGNEGQTVSQEEYEAYKEMHKNDKEYIFFEVPFANSTRRLEDFE